MSSKVGFFCQWTIENFGFCEEEIRVWSPGFTVTMLNDTHWNLCLLVKFNKNNAYCYCRLKRNNDKGPIRIELFYEISIIIGPDHKLEPTYASHVEEYFEAKTTGKKHILMSYKDYEDYFKDNFEKETLIVYCHMWKGGITDTIKYFIRTPIKTHKRYLRWVLKDISSLKEEEYLLKYSERDSSPYKLKLNFRNYGSIQSMHAYIHQMEPSRRQPVKCKISLLDTEGKILVSKQGKGFFSSTGGEGAWTFPRWRESQWILNYKDSLLPNYTLYLLAEMQMGGAGVDEMEQINFGDGFDELLVSSKDSKDQTTQSNTLTANSLMKNLLNFFNDGKLCDVVLKTDCSSFPVHKVILCAQSPVFTTMLETDLKEKQSEMQCPGGGVDGMEQINFGEDFDELLVSSKDSKDQATQSNTLTANSLMNNLLNFYNDGKLCDVVLKTDSSSFPVHKVILCAQSSVFTTMLETDLLEKQTGTIPIPNMSDDKMEPSRRQQVKCKISLLDTEGKILVSKQGKGFFSSTGGEGAWTFPRWRESQWILNYKDSLLPNYTLYLLAEMQMSGAGVDEMEQINFGDDFDELLVSSKDSKDQTTQSNTLTANSLMSNLLNFYNDGKLCDVVLKTDSSSFPVHKVILCAQSPVFTTMLETDLLEKQTARRQVMVVRYR
ncbi:hypothetical protein JTE90_000452 [Oedothorax gibbosus]|uniref:BTB domain-containing protein n=1 Tax=Oedothorax gibbosus TaxID=931172 RepID=A0AAV6UGM5_9ARAC|nr:hypothetical protein JTE90_000452 [Oedothorax gibbosus]